MEELKQLLLPIVVKDCKNLATNEFLRLEFLSQISSFNFRWVLIQAKRKGSKIIWPFANFYESSNSGIKMVIFWSSRKFVFINRWCTNDHDGTTQWTIIFWGICSIHPNNFVSNSKSQVLSKDSFLALYPPNILTFFVGGFHRGSQSSFEKPSSMATIWQFPAYWMMASAGLLHHHFKITLRTAAT